MDRIKQSKITEEYLSRYYVNNNQRRLDQERKRASRAFEGAINYASIVFCNQLVLGGAYEVNKHRKIKIMEHLKAITDILENKAQ